MAFKPGQSGNPRGRTAGQNDARKRGRMTIAMMTDDGEEIVKRLLLLSRGVTDAEELERLGGDKAFADGRIAAKTTDRLRMAQAATIELRDQFFGKPTNHVEVEQISDATAEVDEKLAALTPEQLAALAAIGEDLTERASTPAPAVAPAPDAPALH